MTDEQLLLVIEDMRQLAAALIAFGDRKLQTVGERMQHICTNGSHNEIVRWFHHITTLD